jgi:hypothetical protein
MYWKLACYSKSHYMAWTTDQGYKAKEMVFPSKALGRAMAGSWIVELEALEATPPSHLRSSKMKVPFAFPLSALASAHRWIFRPGTGRAARSLKFGDLVHLSRCSPNLWS